jgi:hypothetical protein
MSQTNAKSFQRLVSVDNKNKELIHLTEKQIPLSEEDLEVLVDVLTVEMDGCEIILSIYTIVYIWLFTE